MILNPFKTGPSFSERHSRFFGALISLILIFILLLTVYLAVGIVNSIKENKYIGQDIESRNTITVSDSAEIYAKPDLAIATFSVVSEAKTVNQAMSDNTQKMNKIINSMKESGIKEEDLKTTTFSISPRYNYYEGTRVLVGYEVIQSLETKIRQLDNLGEIVQKATDSGANQVGNLQFTIDKEDDLRKQAREEAIKKTKEKAKELAKQLGVDLVRIVNFSDSSQTPRTFYDYYPESSIGIGGGGGVSIESGQNKIEVTVTITYEIN